MELLLSFANDTGMIVDVHPVEEIKKEVKPSIREKLALNVAKIQREEAERKQLNKGRSHSSDLEL